MSLAQIRKFSVYKCLRVRAGTFKILFRGNLYSSEENFFLLYISQVQIKKRRKHLPVIRKSVPLQADYYLIRISI